MNLCDVYGLCTIGWTQPALGPTLTSARGHEAVDLSSGAVGPPGSWWALNRNSGQRGPCAPVTHGAPLGVSCEALPGGEPWPFVPRLPHHGVWRLQRLSAGQPPGNQDQWLHSGGHPCAAPPADQHVSAQVAPAGTGPARRPQGPWESCAVPCGRSLGAGVTLWPRDLWPHGQSVSVSRGPTGSALLAANWSRVEAFLTKIRTKCEISLWKRHFYEKQLRLKRI